MTCSIKYSTSVSSFKNLKHNPIKSVSDIFINCVPRRLNVVVLCQLRNNASELNYDKHLDHLVDDASCACGAQTENTEHLILLSIENNHKT